MTSRTWLRCAIMEGSTQYLSEWVKLRCGSILGAQVRRSPRRDYVKHRRRELEVNQDVVEVDERAARC